MSALWKCVCGLLAMGMVSAAPADEGPRAGWQYDGVADVRPTARSISLSPERPQDFEVDVDFAGTQQLYAQLRYGSENSRRVVVVVDDLGDRKYAIYADQDRDRTLTDDELLEGNGRTRTLGLATEIIQEDRALQAMRQVELKLGITGRRISVATLGAIAGDIPWAASDGPLKLQVRRIDGNANGIFADARDRIMLDLDGNGEWDRITEQFAYKPILKIGGRRYGVRSDRLGDVFSLSEVNGEGTLRVTVGALPAQAKLLAFETMVFSNDGSSYSFRSLDEAAKVPVGSYALGSVTLTVDTGEKNRWHFVFSRSGAIDDDHWVQVARDDEVTLEAIGTTQFELNANVDPVRPGATLQVSPTLHTESGLLMNLCSKGPHMGSFDRERFHNPCDIRITSAEGKTISSAKSGFS